MSEIAIFRLVAVLLLVQEAFSLQDEVTLRGGKLILADEFDTLNYTTRQHLITAWRGGED